MTATLRQQVSPENIPGPRSCHGRDLAGSSKSSHFENKAQFLSSTKYPVFVSQTLQTLRKPAILCRQVLYFPKPTTFLKRPRPRNKWARSQGAALLALSTGKPPLPGAQPRLRRCTNGPPGGIRWARWETRRPAPGQHGWLACSLPFSRAKWRRDGWLIKAPGKLLLLEERKWRPSAGPC